MLDVYGHLFYAGARTLERRLPSPRGAENPVVVLRLRGHSTVGATLVDVLAHYADELQRAGGRLYLTGISENVRRQLEHMKKLQLSGPVRVYEASSVRGESTRRTYTRSHGWWEVARRHERRHVVRSVGIRASDTPCRRAS